MYKRWRKTGREGERDREKKKTRGGSNQSSELSMSILPPHSFISAPISFNPTLSLSLSFSPSLPCPLLFFLYLFLSSSRSVPLCLHLHPSHFSLSHLWNLPFQSLPSLFCCSSLPLCFHFCVCHPPSIIHPFHVFLCLSSLTPFCLTISLPLLWL